MSAEYELGRAMRTSNRGNSLVQRTQEACAMIGIPEADPRGESLPNRQAIDEAATLAVNSMGRIRDNFIAGDFARGLMGDGWARQLVQHQQEAGSEGAIDASFFRNIIGQLNVTYVQLGYEDPSFVADRLFEVRQEPDPWNLGTHIIPKISSVIQGPGQIQPGGMYPSATVIQDYTTDPAIGKFGEVLRLTLEAIGTDRTGQMGRVSRDLGFRAKYDEEVQKLCVVAGITVTQGTITITGNNFNWLGTAYNTYQTGGSNWINALSGVSVAGNNYTMYANLEALMSNILDPYSGIVIGNNISRADMALLCPYAIRYEHKNILKAGDIRSGPYGTSTPNYQTNAPNPLDFDYELIPSAILYQLLVAAGKSASAALNYFYIGAFKRAFHYRQVLPWSVITAPPLTQEDFNQDIVQQIKVRRMGIPAVTDPRFVFESFNT